MPGKNPNPLADYRILAPRNPHRPAYTTFQPSREEAARLVRGGGNSQEPALPAVDRVDHHGVTVRICDRPTKDALYFIVPADFKVPPQWAAVALGYTLDKADRKAVADGFVAHGCNRATLESLLSPPPEVAPETDSPVDGAATTDDEEPPVGDAEAHPQRRRRGRR